MMITYLSEPVADYSKGLNGCASLTELQTFLADWRLLANDALIAAESMNERDWKVYHGGFKSERRGRYAGDAWALKYGAILMPEIMMRVSLVAVHFKTPWGLAYKKCLEHGKIIEQDGIAIWNELSS